MNRLRFHHHHQFCVPIQPLYPTLMQAERFWSTVIHLAAQSKGNHRSLLYQIWQNKLAILSLFRCCPSLGITMTQYKVILGNQRNGLALPVDETAMTTSRL